MEWKRAKVIPIFKGGKATDEPLNYRPVSLTSVWGKLCEVTIKEKWVKYLEEKQVIWNRQFGFRTCVSNLLSFYTRELLQDWITETDGWTQYTWI